MFLFHDPGLACQRYPTRVKQRLRITHAERLQRLVMVEQFVVDLAERDLDIKMQPRLKLLEGERGSRAVAESVAKLREAFVPQRQARGHLVPAMFLQELSALRQHRNQRQPFDAAPTPLADPVFIETDD